MSGAPHPAATDHLPWFFVGPGQTDVLMVATTIVVVGAIFGLGVLFFRIHSLPEQLGHKKLQFEIVAVLGLLSLLTHVHAFWVAGLLLAVIDLPDFLTPLKRIAGSLEKMSGTECPPAEEKLEAPPLPPTTAPAAVAPAPRSSSPVAGA